MSRSTPIGTVHRLVNAGQIALELAKVKSGSYLWGRRERFDDVYRRDQV